MLSIIYKNIFKKGFSMRAQSTAPVLGRWSLEFSQQKLNRKVDLANEDHCGCCDDTKKEIKQSEKVYMVCGYDDVVVLMEDSLKDS